MATKAKKQVVVPYKPTIGDVLYNKVTSGTNNSLVKGEVYGTITDIDKTYIIIKKLSTGENLKFRKEWFIECVFNNKFYVILPEKTKTTRTRKVKGDA